MINRPLRIFLCHSSNDKPAVRELYQKLRTEAWIQPWLDEEELYPGQDWDMEIEKAVEASDAVLVCLSNTSINKRGYVQKELRFVLDIALEMPEETIFIIPLRLESCIPPRSLREWQYADYFPTSQRERAFQRLLVSLKRRADSLGLMIEHTPSVANLGTTAEEQDDAVAWLESLAAKHGAKPEELVTNPNKRSDTPPNWVQQVQNLNQQPITQPSIEGLGSSAQEQDDAIAWLESLAAKHGAKPEELITNPNKRSDIPPNWIQQAQNINQQPTTQQPSVENLGSSAQEQDDAIEWLESLAAKHGARPEELITVPNKTTLSNGMEFMRVPAGKFLMGSKDDNKFAYSNEKLQHTVDIPYDYWMGRFPVTNEFYNVYLKFKGISGWIRTKKTPVVDVKWPDAIKYCIWLNNILVTELPSGLILRLPTEAEWEKAARGVMTNEWPWGNEFEKNNCNTEEGGKRGTTPLGLYSPQGDSPYGCSDMVGNVWEWTHSLFKEYPYNVKDGRENGDDLGFRTNRGGSFHDWAKHVRCASRRSFDPHSWHDDLGFRVCLAPPLPK